MPAVSQARDESLVGQAYREIEELIVSLQLAPGVALSEAQLSSRLGIGRTPVREALHHLAREGLIMIAPRRGIFVTEIKVDAQLRLLEVRRGLERVMAARAARLASAGDRNAFAALAGAMREAAQDDLAFLRLDQQFNRMVSDAAANEFAAASMRLMAGLSRRFWFCFYGACADLPLTARLHAEVADAIADGDSERAGRASDQLIDYLERFTRTVRDHES